MSGRIGGCGQVGVVAKEYRHGDLADPVRGQRLQREGWPVVRYYLPCVTVELDQVPEAYGLHADTTSVSHDSGRVRSAVSSCVHNRWYTFAVTVSRAYRREHGDLFDPSPKALHRS